jgi:mannose-6-phosphate isomerase-like protein (cupin superfamily)
MAIPRSIAAQVLFHADRTCCVCREHRRSLQIHHVDGDPRNHAVENLAALCLDCHTETQKKGGFYRRLDPVQVRLYRDDWLRRVGRAPLPSPVPVSPAVAVREYNFRMDAVNLQQKLALFSDHWSPKIVGEVNDAQVKLVKLHGEFVWHHHDHEDELFLVVNGVLTMQFRDRNVEVRAGEFIIVPRGVEHCPKAEQECHVLLFEPKTTLNTGNITNERTIAELGRV